MSDAVSRIVQDPAWLAHRYDPSHDAVHFIHVPREQHRRATFLTDAYLPRDDAPIVLRRAEAVAAARAVTGPIHYVFHSAFCCSTLIARALDREGWAMGLKEPVILNDLVGWRRRGARPADLRGTLDGALTLLARRFGPGEVIAIKPSNVVNGLAMEMMALRPEARALMVYAPLADFLASIAKKGLDGRTFARELFVHQLKDGLVRLGFDQDQLFQQTDLQIAAMGWLVQNDLFRAIATRFGSARARLIDSRTLLAAPHRAMTALAHLFGLPADAALIDELVSGPAFATHSKDGSSFGAEARAAEYDAARDRHADEIARVIAWTATVAEGAKIPLEPGPALF